MKQFLFLLLIFSMLFSACNMDSRPPLLSRLNLKSSFINLDAAAAYTLKTAKGAIIKIEENSFKTNGSTKLQLEIKEAYSMQDILLAGLSTESNGKLLKSGGMIYINATAGNEQVELLKPIKISIPTEVYDNSMQLFKGEIKDDSSINWIDPQPLDTAAFAKKLALGKKLFITNCGNCHKLFTDFTGPVLAGVRDRAPDRDWPYRFITTPAKIISEGDPYANTLYRKWRVNGMMAGFNLSRAEISAILDYCDNEALKNKLTDEAPIADLTKPDGLEKPDSAAGCFVLDTIYNPVNNKTGIQIITNDTTSTPSMNISGRAKAADLEGLRGSFTDPVSNETELYEFSIATLGWFNVDAEVEGYDGTKLVSINAQLQMNFNAEMHLYLFCPDKKNLSVSNFNEKNTYSFHKIDGKIPMFLNDKAILLAFGSVDNQLWYGTASFNVKTSQYLQIKMKATTEDQLKSFIEFNKIDGIQIDARKKQMILQPNPVTKDSVPVEMNIFKVACNSVEKK